VILFQLATQDLSSSLAVLTAMITPAVLMSACGSLILSTASRMARTVDRVRSLLSQLEDLANTKDRIALFDERREIIYKMLDLTAKRNRLLQRSMVTFYFALCLFVATSVSIGLVAITGRGYEWLPAVSALAGTCFLFYGSILLIFETRIAHQAIFMEMDFSLRLSRKFVPQTVVEENKKKRRGLPSFRFGRKKMPSEISVDKQ
jgi:hypothetical protein